MILWLNFLFFVSVYGQSGYEPCLTRDDRSGTCSYFQYCPQARSDYMRGVGITFCNNYNRNVICCPSTSHPNHQVSSSRTQRISEKKCEEYSKSTKQVSFVSSLSLASTLQNHQAFENPKCIQSTSLITGGEVAKLGEFPHMAAIGWEELERGNYVFSCGGSLISNNFVLTAAHCNIRQLGGSAKIVRLGDHNLNTENDGARHIDVPILQFIMHDRYERKLNKNDIALLKLARSVSFADNIRPACLWQSHTLPASITTATGYGKTNYYSQNSNELLKVQLKVFDNQKCVDFAIDSTQMCVGAEKHDEGKDTCQGDSGGPLQIHYGSNKCIFYITGITSFGNSYCGGEPGIYTRVSSYIDWIEGKVWA